MSEYFTERVSVNNLPDLITLYKEAFGLRVTIEFLTKKFDTRNFGSSYIGYIAYHEATKKAVAFYGVFPMRGLVGNEKLLIAQSGDTMTHPQHQGKGLFIMLATKTYDLAKAEGVSFVFGFPNKNSYPGFIKKLAWDHYANMNNYSIATSSVPLDKISKKFPVVSGFYRLFVESILQKYQTAEYPVNSFHEMDQQFGCIPHDEQFYDYKKYFKNYRLNIDGILCTIKIDGRLWVGDIEYRDEDSFIRRVKFLVNLARKVGCSSVDFSLHEGCVQDKALQKHYAVKSTSPVGCVNLQGQMLGRKFAYNALDFDTF